VTLSEECGQGIGDDVADDGHDGAIDQHLGQQLQGRHRWCWHTERKFLYNINVNNNFKFSIQIRIQIDFLSKWNCIYKPKFIFQIQKKKFSLFRKLNSMRNSGIKLTQILLLRRFWLRGFFWGPKSKKWGCPKRRPKGAWGNWSPKEAFLNVFPQTENTPVNVKIVGFQADATAIYVDDHPLKYSLWTTEMKEVQSDLDLIIHLATLEYTVLLSREYCKCETHF